MRQSPIAGVSKVGLVGSRGLFPTPPPYRRELRETPRIEGLFGLRPKRAETALAVVDTTGPVWGFRFALPPSCPGRGEKGRRESPRVTEGPSPAGGLCAEKHRVHQMRRPRWCRGCLTPPPGAPTMRRTTGEVPEWPIGPVSKNNRPLANPWIPGVFAFPTPLESPADTCKRVSNGCRSRSCEDGQRGWRALYAVTR